MSKRDRRIEELEQQLQQQQRPPGSSARPGQDAKVVVVTPKIYVTAPGGGPAVDYGPMELPKHVRGTRARTHTRADTQTHARARTHACTHARTHAHTHTHSPMRGGGLGTHSPPPPSPPPPLPQVLQALVAQQLGYRPDEIFAARDAEHVDAMRRGGLL